MKGGIFIPIDERVNKISRMAINWAKLGMKKNEDKKIAVIFHNMPPRNDMIGRAFGLDTPNSVNNMMKLFPLTTCIIFTRAQNIIY